MSKLLRISADLGLPPEAVTETFAVLAKRGAGKTYTAAVLVEELAAAGMQFVVVDPIGVWWGLRASADGKQAGIPVVVLGGDHGDVPLEVAGGALVADLVVDEGLSIVLDLGRFRKGEQIRFMTDFAEQLYRRNRSPLHLVLDEADAFAPQKPRPEGARLLGAIEDLVRRGRARGIGVTLVTQRSAVLNKDVLTQAEVLVALRTTHPRDRDAIQEWAKAHGTQEQLDELQASLASLPIGEAWFWSPGWLDVFKRVRIRERETFDSSATPKVGEKPKAPKKLADVDLAALRDRMASVIEKAKAEDPAELRRQLSATRKELENEKRAHSAHTEGLEARAAAIAAKSSPPVISDEQLRALREDLGHFDRMATGLTSELASRVDDLRDLERNLVSRFQILVARVEKHSAGEGRTRAPAPSARTREAGKEAGHAESGPRRPESPGPVAPPRARPGSGVPVDGVELKKGARRMLEILAAAEPRALTNEQLSTLAQVTKGGTYSSYLSNLRAAGLIDENGEGVTVSDLGRAAAGDVPPIQGPEEIIAAYQAKLKLGARRMLDLLYEHPDGLSRDELSELAEVTKGGTFSSYLSNLRAKGLIDERRGGLICLSETLFLGAA